MDSFELNKIMGAVLGTLVFVMGLGFLAEAIYHPIENRGVGYALPEPEEGGSQTAEAEPEATPLPVLLANASADAGSSVARRCQSCHSFEEGGANMTGPNLYDVVGRQIAGVSGFGYSSGMQTYAEENGEWSYALLDAFIHDPQGEVDGTSMSFAGLSDEEDRADLLAYLQTLSGEPVPFPEPEAEAPDGETDEGEAATKEGAPAEDASANEASEEDASTEETPAEGDVDAAADEGGAGSGDAADDEAAEGQATEGAETEGDAEAAAPAEDDASGEAGTTDAEQPAAEENGDAATEGDGASAEDAAASEGEGSELENMIADASAEEGARLMRQCQACHDWAEDGSNKIGPLLWDVVGNPIASVDDYSYSDALVAHGEENGEWSYEALDAFIADPRGVVDGTKMSFGGVGDAEDRAAIIAFLRQQSPEPAPLGGE